MRKTVLKILKKMLQEGEIKIKVKEDNKVVVVIQGEEFDAS